VINIAIFASGTGSNAQNIFNQFKAEPKAHIALIVSNKDDAGVLEFAEQHEIPYAILGKDEMDDEETVMATLEYHKIDFIVLAGYLLLVPQYLIKAYPSRIVNIHPALLPAHGGKGMYGTKVHEAVKAAGDAETGITIHYVNEHFDEGETIAQMRCEVAPNDTAEDIRLKVQVLEHEHYHQVIKDLVKKLSK
jgi:phosphoribosylglycinamide formyltransferase-1